MAGAARPKRPEHGGIRRRQPGRFGKVRLNEFRRLHAGDGLTVDVEAARKAASTSW
ncbi:hypothetical protein [Streptomyces sp. NPDC057582]|uniref:hypothetical protein n=1 Tax=Streptomyces sp. NPDC057582 TaxID=3346174 RepID=UPI0036C8F5CE